MPSWFAASIRPCSRLSRPSVHSPSETVGERDGTGNPPERDAFARRRAGSSSANGFVADTRRHWTPPRRRVGPTDRSAHVRPRWCHRPLSMLPGGNTGRADRRPPRGHRRPAVRHRRDRSHHDVHDPGGRREAQHLPAGTESPLHDRHAQLLDPLGRSAQSRSRRHDQDLAVLGDRGDVRRRARPWSSASLADQIEHVLVPVPLDEAGDLTDRYRAPHRAIVAASAPTVELRGQLRVANSAGSTTPTYGWRRGGAGDRSSAEQPEARGVTAYGRRAP